MLKLDILKRVLFLCNKTHTRVLHYINYKLRKNTAMGTHPKLLHQVILRKILYLCTFLFYGT
jgi:hypothetical protein